MSLREAFAAATAGSLPSHDAIVRHVREIYLTRTDSRNPHWKRRRLIAQRLRYYEDDYDQDALALIKLVFENKQVRRQRARLVELSKPMNITKRVVDEMSAVYDKPAKRMLPEEADQVRYDDVGKVLELHEARNEQHRLTNLCNEVLIWAAVSQATEQVTMRTVTPDMFDVVPDPRDDLVPGAILLDAAPATLSTDAGDIAKLPHHELWDDTYCYKLDAKGQQVSIDEHGLGRIPGYLQHRRKPRTELLDASAGADLISAHGCVVLLNLMILRLAKSQGENQPFLSGNLARVASGQPFDGETPIPLPPGVVAKMLQSKTTPDHYMAAIKHFISGVAATYGMSYEQFVLQEGATTSSGKAYQVRREKLTEIRDQQVLRSDTDEREIAVLISDTLTAHGLDAFDPSDLLTIFSDPRIPQDAGEEYALLRTGVELGADSVIQFVMRKYGMSREEARRRILQNIKDRAEFVILMRALNMPASATEPGRDPADNGADNEPDDDETEGDDNEQEKVLQ